MRTLVTSTLAALSLLAPASLAAQTAAAASRDWRSLVGCYREGARTYALDSLPKWSPFHPDGSFQAWGYWIGGRDLYWRPLGGDSVEFGGGDSLHGWKFLGVIRDRGIEGTRAPWTDIILPSGSGPQPRRMSLVREPCGTDGVTDGPPPDAQMLLDSFPARMAAVIADSILPALRGGAPVGFRYEDNPYALSAHVGRALVRRTGLEGTPSDGAVTWMYLTDFATDRDRVAASVVTAACPSAGRGNVSATRRRVRLRREGSGWVPPGWSPGRPSGSAAGTCSGRHGRCGTRTAGGR